MNLRDLLLEMAGENSTLLEVEEIISNNDEFSVVGNSSDGVYVETTRKKTSDGVDILKKLLKEKGYNCSVFSENDKIIVTI